MKPAHLIIPTAALGAALLAAGCGGDSEASPAPRAQQVQADLPAGRIAFRRYLDGAQTTGAVFTVKPDGTGEKQITHPPAGVVDDQPDWSPDGRTIAFERCSDEAPCSVWTVDATGGEPAQVHVRCKLEPVCDASAPVWTPDGRLVVDLAQGRERPTRRARPDRALLARAAGQAGLPAHDRRTRPLDGRREGVDRFTGRAHHRLHGLELVEDQAGERHVALPRSALTARTGAG